MGRLSLVAGSGELPHLVLGAALQAGWDVQVLRFEADAVFEGVETRTVSVTKPLDIILAIRSFKSSHICVAGGVHISDKGRRGLFKALMPGRRKPQGSGDAGLAKLGRAVEIASGAKLVGAHEIMPDLLARAGLIGGPKPKRNLQAVGQFAINSARASGILDLGQAVVCSGHRLVAIEDIAGTDALMERVLAFRQQGLIGDGGEPLVMAKAKKPRQPMFADLPAIGANTIASAQRAGLDAIVVEADMSLIIDREGLRLAATKAGITVIALCPDDS